MSEGRHDPVDPDVDLSVPEQLAEVAPREWDLLAAIAAGGVLGAEARYGMSRWITHPTGTMPWSTVVINLAGSLLLGVLMAVVAARGTHRLLRPFLGVGVLGGFTTFSTFTVDIDTLLHAHRPGVALAYLALTLAGCLLTVTSGFRCATRLLRGPG